MNRKHLKCLFWKGLWGLSLISLVLAWVAGTDAMVLGLSNTQWFWNALVFGVLAIPIKLDCHSCGVCGIQ